MERLKPLNDVYTVTQTDHSKLKGTTKITDGTNIVTVTAEGYQDVKTHTPDFCFTHDYATEQTDLTILTPTAGKKIRVISVYTSAATDSKNVALVFATSGDIIFKLYVAKKFTDTGNVICKTGAVDEAIKLTCPSTTFISIGYDEVD